MTDRPILFSAPMVRAILAGTKTQTRRTLKDQATWDRVGEAILRRYPQQQSGMPYAVGQRLWVREAWRAWSQYDDWPPSRIPACVDVQYAADDPLSPWVSRARSSIHLPRWASRLTLLVTDVKVERLQAISEEDAMAEGCVAHGRGLCTENPDDYAGSWSARTAFRDLWGGIHGPDAWARNPFVAVITFRPIRANIDAPEAQEAA